MTKKNTIKNKKTTKSSKSKKQIKWPNLRVLSVFVIFGLVAIVAVFMASAAVPVSTSKLPAVRALGVYPGFGGTVGLSKLESIENYLGRTVLTASAYTEANSWSGFNSSNYGNFENPNSLFVKRKDVRPALAVALNTNATGGLTNKPGGPAIIRAGLFDVANGKYDDNYKKLAEKLMNSGQKRAILRLGSEGDIGWTPWSYRNGNEDAFKAAFRHVAKLMRATPGNEFLIDFMGNGSFNLPYTTRTGVMTTHAEASYPGSDVVDIIGIDVYNRKNWDYVKDKLDFTQAMAKKYGKSMSIPEWGIWVPDTGDDPQFIQNMYNWMNTTPSSGAGKLEYHTYFWGNKNANLDQAPKSKAKFKELFGIGNTSSGSGGAPTPTPAPSPAPTPSPTPTPTPAPSPSTNLPDVIIVPGSIKSVPATPVNGNKVTFEATIKNIGNAATPNGVVHGIGFRIDGKLVSWSDYSTNSLAAGQSRKLTANGGPSALGGSSTWDSREGSFELKALWDDVGRIEESNESNNTLSRSITVGSSTPVADTSKPTVPSKPKPVVISQLQISLSWSPSSDNQEVTHYKIYRNGQLIATQTGTNYTDSNLSPSTTYLYTVTAVDASGNESDASAVLSAVTSSVPTQNLTTTTPNTDQPLSLTPENQVEAISIPNNDQPTIAGSIKLENPTAPGDSAKTILKINDKEIKSADGNTVEFDTSTLPNDSYVVTLETTGLDGATSTTSRVVNVDNDLNVYEKARNALFAQSNGKYSGAQMNSFMAGASIILLSVVGVVIYLLISRKSTSLRLK